MTTAYDTWTEQQTWTQKDGTLCKTWSSDKHRVEFFAKRPAIGCVHVCVSYADRDDLCIRTGTHAVQWLQKWTEARNGYRKMREAYTEQVNRDSGWDRRPQAPTIFDDLG